MKQRVLFPAVSWWSNVILKTWRDAFWSLCLCYQIVSCLTLFCHTNTQCCKALNMLMYSRPTCHITETHCPWHKPVPISDTKTLFLHLCLSLFYLSSIYYTSIYASLYSIYYTSIYASLCQCWTWLWLGVGGMINILFHGMTNFISRYQYLSFTSIHQFIHSFIHSDRQTDVSYNRKLNNNCAEDSLYTNITFVFFYSNTL